MKQLLLSTYKLFIVTILMITTTAVASASARMSINGCPAFADDSTHSLLASVPQEWFRSTVTATINGIGDLQVMSIDGIPIDEASTFTFQNIDGTKLWQVVITSGDSTTTYSLQFTYLPIVLLEGNPGYEYVDGSMVIAEPGQSESETMLARLKWRGFSTNVEGKHKRNYSIKFINANGEKQNRKLLGLRRDNHWILDAGQPDMARCRNRVATDLWLDMARDPYHYELAPDALTGGRGKMVEVFLGNDYRGIFNLMEPVDRKQLQLVQHDTINNVFHGGLWKTDKFNSVTGFRIAPEYNDSLPDYYSFVTKYPDFDEVFPTSYKVLYDAVLAMENSEYIGYYNRLAEQHFDIPIMIDYTILCATLNANDNEPKNIYWYCYDRQTDPRLSLAVWDFDTSVGQSWEPSEWRPPKVASDYFNQPYSWIFKMFLHNKCKFRQDFLDRYDELRQSWLSTENLIQRYSNAIDMLIDCGAAKREQDRWNGDSDLFGHDLNFEEEKQYITQWIEERMPLLDVWMHHHICDVNFDGAVNAADITRIYNHILFGDIDAYDTNLDTNFDGVINVADITSVYSVILGL